VESTANPTHRFRRGVGSFSLNTRELSNEPKTPSLARSVEAWCHPLLEAPAEGSVANTCCQAGKNNTLKRKLFRKTLGCHFLTCPDARFWVMPAPCSKSCDSSTNPSIWAPGTCAWLQIGDSSTNPAIWAPGNVPGCQPSSHAGSAAGSVFLPSWIWVPLVRLALRRAPGACPMYF